jgi:AcrR family transcriptional regulator
LKKSTEVKNAIIKSAQIVFNRYGFERTTMELIANEAGKGKSTLYYYFKNKEEIYVAVIEEEWNFLQTETFKVIDQNIDIKTIFESFSLKRFKLANKVTNYSEAMTNKYSKHNALIGEAVKKFSELEVLAVKQILLKGIANNELRIKVNEVDEIAMSISITIKGLEAPFIIEDQKSTLEKKLNILLDLLFHGLLKR